jgi:SAM-dependent methyltransferase
MYKNKYLKYKNKYINLKTQIGGNDNCLYLNDTLTDEKISEFKQKLDDRNLFGFKNWLVIYAGYTTPTEQIRFKNQNWIFWDQYKDDRYSIKGLFNEENLMKLDGILSNTFDYICFDDSVAYYYKGDDKEKLIYRLLKILKPGGVLVINNMLEITDNLEDDYSKIFFLSKKSISTPYGIGYGGYTLLDKIFKIVEYIKYQKIETVNLSDYNNIWSLISSLNEQFSEISNCNHTLKMIIRNISKKISPESEYCKEFLEKYREINQYCDNNEENLNKEYQELLGKLEELWSFPNYSTSIEDSNNSELFFIKIADYPLEV